MSPSACCLDDDDVDARARVPLPADARGTICRGGIGSWLVLVPGTPSSPARPADDDLPCRAAAAPFLINGFSLHRVPLPAWTNAGGRIYKAVLSSTPDSPRATCVVAAMTVSRGTVAVCQPGKTPPPFAWTSVTFAFDIEDIAFHKGDLYLLDSSEHLRRVDVRELVGGRLCIQHCGVEAVGHDKINATRRYLVELDGTLLLVRRSTYVPYLRGVVGDVSSLLSLRHDYDGVGERRQWVPLPAGVTLNDGRFLVVGNTCCGSFPAVRPLDRRKVCFVGGRVSWVTIVNN
ncbi:hypothetical protein ABZP36_009776 [Zizania latifolia]